MMGQEPPDLRDPQWLAHRYDEAADAIRFLRCSREARAAAPFLTDEHLAGHPVAAMPRQTAAAAGGTAPVAPVGFIFHSAYCCSTLLANIFDLPGKAMALKEPQILNDMVGWRHRGADPAAVGAVLDTSLALLARPFAPGEAVIIKPSNVVNGLASAMLTLRPDAPAILLHAPLRAFITSIARKGMWGRLWVRELLSRQLTDGMVDLGFEPRDYLLHTDLQAAAVGWLAQQKLFAALIARWPDRVRSLNSETLVAGPAQAVTAATKLFSVNVAADVIDAAVTVEFGRDAKSGATFDAGQRAAAQAAGEAIHAEEIDKVTAWAEAVAASAGVPMTLPTPLITP
jgi:hypothetical protein